MIQSSQTSRESINTMLADELLEHETETYRAKNGPFIIVRMSLLNEKCTEKEQVDPMLIAPALMKTAVGHLASGACAACAASLFLLPLPSLVSTSFSSSSLSNSALLRFFASYSSTEHSLGRNPLCLTKLFKSTANGGFLRGSTASTNAW